MRLNTPAREVIPQPKLQPNLSKETRRRWQFALLSRAPRKPFSQLSKSHFIQLSKWSDESKPHSVLTNENCMTLTFRMIIRKVERLKLISSLAASICFPALTGRCFRPCSFSFYPGTFPTAMRGERNDETPQSVCRAAIAILRLTVY